MNCLWVKICLMALISLNMSATEVDNFTDRDPNLRNSVAELNMSMAEYMSSAVIKANKENSCESKIIEEALAFEFGGAIGWLLWSTLESDIEKNNFIDKRRSKKSQSIYRNVSCLDGICLALSKLGFTLKFNDLFLGSDKIGHFLHLGQTYFQKVYDHKQSLEEVLAYGEETERTLFGLQTTGVYSYADLVANYEGFKFWKRVTNIDLPKNQEPYFRCEDNIWEQRIEFDWLDYVNPSWDEAVNCNRYRNEAMTMGILQQIENLDLVCPISRETCVDLIKYYGDLSPSLISQACFNA